MSTSEQIRPFTTEVERSILCKYAKDATVLEIGSYDGASAIAMASVAQVVYCIDPFLEDKAVNQDIKPSISKFLINTLRIKNIHLLHGTNMEILPLLRPNKFGMVFVDGSHTYENASYDLVYARLLATETIAAHDCNWPGVARAVQELMGNHDLIENYEDVLKVWRVL